MAKRSALVGLAALGLASGQALAAPVSVSGTKPTANVKVLKPLQLSVVRNLNFGTIVMSSVTTNQTVRVAPAGRTCGTGPALTCSGTFSTAQYRVNGTNNQQVIISSSSPTYALTGSNGGSLTLTPTFPTSVTIDNSGNPGVLFEVGGSFVITPTTPDGLYSGTIDIQVAYQ
ncbi:DUF4402 domain-containing protein [Sphingomonas swuensis]